MAPERRTPEDHSKFRTFDLTSLEQTREVVESMRTVLAGWKCTPRESERLEQYFFTHEESKKFSVTLDRTTSQIVYVSVERQVDDDKIEDRHFGMASPQKAETSTQEGDAYLVFERIKPDSTASIEVRRDGGITTRNIPR